jgi:hypothetical protein
MKLTLQRCLVHVDREAVVRCPSCGDYFCRECVTEHEHKYLCSCCLQRVTPRAEPARWNAAWFMSIIKMTLGIAVAWLFFYLIGQSLILIPARVQDGSYLKSLGQ